MIEKYLGGEIPEIQELEPDSVMLPLYQSDMENMHFALALNVIWGLIGLANTHIDKSEPWQLAKSNEEEDRELLKKVLVFSAQVLKASAVLLSPFMPTKMQMIWEQLGHTEPLESVRIDITNPDFFMYEKGQKIVRGPAPFPRIETEKIKAKKAASAAAIIQPSPPAPLPESEGLRKDVGRDAPGAPELISIDDFMKVDLRVGKILQAERVPKSDKLVKMKIDIGAEIRQIVGGIGKAYSPEELVGRTVVVVANLKPAKLMGIESQGMVLAAGDVNTLKLAGFDAVDGASLPAPGTRVK